MPRKRDPRKPHSRAHRGPVGPRNAPIVLPKAGCTLDAPPMPEGREWSDVERARWAALWGSPQANEWDETVVGTVAKVVIFESAMFAGEASAWMAQEHRHAETSLGLTPLSLVQLGWRIGETE